MGNKITTLVLNCLTAFFSMFAIVKTYLFCQYGRTVFFFTQSKDPIYRTGELVSEVEFLLALVSMGLGVISFFILRKNKRKKYLLIQLLLFRITWRFCSAVWPPTTTLRSGRSSIPVRSAPCRH